MSEMIDAALAFDKYSDATYDYFGEAPPSSAVNEANWRVSRMNLATKKVEWVAGGTFTQVFTDVATVAALTYA